MSSLNTRSDDDVVAYALTHASGVPDMPAARIHEVAMAAFPASKPVWTHWASRVGALAATIVLGVGGFMAFQSYQSEQKALSADADAFAEQLLSESF